MENIEIIEYKVPIASKVAQYEILDYNDTFSSNIVVYTIEKNTKTSEQEFKEFKSIQSHHSQCETIEQFYDVYVKRSFDECIDEYNAPQRTFKWHMARKYSITASNFGAASGNNKYCSPEMCINEKLWSSFKGNDATEYGSYHEKDACESLKLHLNDSLKKTLNSIVPGFLSYEIYETGLLKSPECPWMAVSPDGLLKICSETETKWILLEYKCPARLRHSTGHPYNKKVPCYYLDQIQGICGLLNEYPEILSMISKEKFPQIQDIFFIVWQPEQFHITRIKYDCAYYTALKDKLESWYFTKFLPMAFLKHKNELVENSLQVKTL